MAIKKSSSESNSDPTDPKSKPKPAKLESSTHGSSARASGCCMGTTTCSSTGKSLTPKDSSTATLFSLEGSRKGKTRIVIKYDVGFNNHIFLRGKGANLSWDKGVKLKNVKNDEWVWETDMPFANGEFKALINDHMYETGDNHPLKFGVSVEYTPQF